MATTLDPAITPAAPAAEAALASQWRLMWWAFRRHTLAVVGLVVVALLYLTAIFAEFIAPFDPDAAQARHVHHPPQMIHVIDETPDGGWTFRPHVLAYKQVRDKFTLETTYQLDPSRKIHLEFFGRGVPYRLLGLIPTDRHLLVPVDPSDRY